jgi:4-amino-4-deoxy-L-arabinose transferase-like glycosyltransferase
MPELLFTVLLCSTVLCLIKADKYNGWIWFILSSLLLGLASLCRNSTFLLFFVYPIIILFNNMEDIKKILVLKLAVFILLFLALTIPWMYRNQVKLGLFSISGRGGGILSHQAYYAANFSSDEWRAYSLYLVSGRLAQKLYPKIVGNNFGDYEYAYLYRTSYVNGLLQKYREGEVERILLHNAINDIIRHPFKYLLLSAISYVQTFKYFESVPIMFTKRPLELRWLISILKFFLLILGLLYSLVALWGILRSRGLYKSYLILFTIIYFHIVLTSMGIIPGGLQRHILPITVFYSFFVVIAIKRLKCAYS